ncbi:hypothetical protein P879_11480 [Paragonimus westermani]|uniref:Calponin-homology (CH) domain-containing protein n=1 Tax=Paragonimus westermani TaxID=34504 RepID=A0A8T0DCQ7_9TREM|nr:hypothetical protein P879_11480 [Paragonimus westermani]
MGQIGTYQTNKKLVTNFYQTAINKTHCFNKEDTASFPQPKEVEVVDFTSSWRDGLAFCALLHRHYPELIDFDHLTKMHSEPVKRLEITFSQAAEHLGIPKLIEPIDLIGGGGRRMVHSHNCGHVVSLVE